MGSQPPTSLPHDRTVPNGMDITFPFEGKNTLAQDDFELPLFLVPVAYIPAVDPDGDGTIGNLEIAPIPRAPIDEGCLLITQLGLTPLGDGQSVGADSRHTERLVDGQKVCERLHRQAIGNQGRPLRFHKEEFRTAPRFVCARLRSLRQALVPALPGTNAVPWCRGLTWGEVGVGPLPLTSRQRRT